MEELNKRPATGLKVAKIIGNILFYTIIACLLFYSLIIITSRSDNNIPNVFGNGFLAVETNSMDGDLEDSFKENDLIFVKILKESDKPLKIGDVITFKDPSKNGALNTHRIVNIIQGHYQTQGDNTSSPDTFLISDDEVVAIYNGKIEGLGGFIEFVQSPIGFGLLVLLPIFLVLVYQGFKVVYAVFAIKKERLVQDHEAEKERMKQELLEELKKQQNL